MSENEKTFRVTFRDKDELIKLHARSVKPSTIIGMVDINDIFFPSSSDILISPEDDKIRKMFSGVTRIVVPIQHITMIEELDESKKGSIKIVEVK